MERILLAYCNVAIVKAREKAAKKAGEEIESMREWERIGVGTINTEAVAMNLVSYFTIACIRRNGYQGTAERHGAF